MKNVWLRYLWVLMNDTWYSTYLQKFLQCTTPGTQQKHRNIPFSIWTFRKQRTMSKAITLPQHWCTSQERPRLCSSMPTISTCTPLGWWDTYDMPGIKWSSLQVKYDRLHNFTVQNVWSELQHANVHRFWGVLGTTGIRGVLQISSVKQIR